MKTIQDVFEIKGATHIYFTWLLIVVLFATGLISGIALGDDPGERQADEFTEHAGVVAWGDNSFGQTMVPLEALSGVIAISAGDSHSLALRDNGSIVAWGQNLSGQGSVPSNLVDIKAIAAGGFHNLALREDGTVFAWGSNSRGQTKVPEGLNDIVAIAAGGFHSLALKRDGTVVAWGYDFWGQSTVPTSVTGVVAIAAGYYRSLALRADGTLAIWGRNAFSEGSVPRYLGRVSAIAAGYYHNLALQEDGTVVAWGRNLFGEALLPAGLTGVIAVAAGSHHSLALKSDRTVVAWGNNDFGQTSALAFRDGVVSIAAGGNHNLAGVGQQSPYLTLEPSSQTAAFGEAIVFEVNAGGSAPFRYQWRKDGIDILGQSNSVFSIGNVQLNDVGDYTVVVGNSLGSVTSRVARLSVGYLLSLEIRGPGTVSVTPNKRVFEPGTEITLAGVPVSGDWRLSWSGDVDGTQSPLTLTMDSNKQVIANFLPTYRVGISATGLGSVTVMPARARYDKGELIEITAVPERWWDFSRWGDGVTSNPRIVAVQSNSFFTAIFLHTTAVETLTFNNISRTAPVGMPALFVDDEFVVTNVVSRLDSATVSMLTSFPNGAIFYTLDGSTPDFGANLYIGPFSVNQSVTLRAAAYDASFLKSWEADPLLVNIEPTYAVNTGTAGGGSVVVSPLLASYRSNTVISMTAFPEPGWKFLQWLGDASGTNAMTSVRVKNRDLCVQAMFGTTLGITVAGNGSVIVNPPMPFYPYGTVVRLTALPGAGHFFGAWGNAVMSTNNPLLLTMTNANPTVSCVFGPLSAGQVALTVLANGRGSVTSMPRGNRFSNGQSVRLTATADADQEFLGWTGDATGTATNLTVLLTGSKVITAHFTRRPRVSVGPCLGGWDDGGFRLTVTGEFGGRFRIEHSDDLEDWETLGGFTNDFGIWQTTDATNRARRFFRAVEQP